MMIEKVPVKAKKEKDNFNFILDRDYISYKSETTRKAQELIDDSIQTLKNSDSKISQTEIDKKINKDLSNLSLAIFNLTRDLKIKNSNNKNN